MPKHTLTTNRRESEPVFDVSVYVFFCGCSGRSGKIRVLSMKIGLLSLSKGHLEEKYKCKCQRGGDISADTHVHLNTPSLCFQASLSRVHPILYSLQIFFKLTEIERLKDREREAGEQVT